MAEQENSPGLVVDQKMMDVLVTNIIPTSRYFEIRFDYLDEKFNRLNNDLLEFKQETNRNFASMKQETNARFDSMKQEMNGRFIGLKQEMDQRFEQMDKRFEQVDKRFEQMDKRFEQIDNRFEQMNTKLDKVLERIDVKIDAGLRENRMITIRLFSFAILFSAISVTGMFARMFHLF